MAVGLDTPRGILPISGVRIGAVDAGIRKSPGEDLTVLEISSNATLAGVFTRNRARAAPVEVAVKHLANGSSHSGSTRALVINSGIANAGVGTDGIQDCLAVCELIASELEISVNAVLPFSTGVIGERLPLDKFERHITNCMQHGLEDNWLAAARAIMTTDTIPKAISKVVDLGGGDRITVTGISKGSGMINPDMATMLAFVATDAELSHEDLQHILNETAEISFNRISVDGDTSTNDSCILIATGASGVAIDRNSSASVRESFTAALQGVMVHLAQAIVRDGEGATKFVTIHVSGGKLDSDCAEVASTVANSPLVKTALNASDPNWGRIYGAIGRSRVENLNMSNVSIHINDIEVMSKGALSSNYCEQDAAEVMRRAEFSINVDLGFDEAGSATVWTCDLSAEYVRINAEYRS